MAGIVVHSGYTVLCCAEDGAIGEGREGLFDFDTRVLSRWALTVDGHSPELVAQAVEDNDRWRAELRVARPGGSSRGPALPQDALEVSLTRAVGPGMRDTIELRNWSAEPFSGRLEICLDADFDDVSGGNDDWRESLNISRRWTASRQTLYFRARAERDGRQLARGLSVRVASKTAAVRSGASLTFDLSLERGRVAAIRLDYVPEVDGAARQFEAEHQRRARQRAAWNSRRTTVDAPERLRAPFDRAAADLFALRNFELERRYLGTQAGAAWVLNAGVPTFTGFFGRDALTSGWQAAMLGPRASLGALAVAASTQAQTTDPWRDAEPGKMIHELRRGPLSELGVTPRDAYYGTQTTPPMFVLALSEVWHWTADVEVLQRFLEPALRAMEWAERFGDIDGDGLLEYQRRSPKGLLNQGWKDSDEAIRHADGSIAEGPIATVEEQAFYFLALQRMAGILLALDEPERADDFLKRAGELRQRWQAAFWMPDAGYYAMALDGNKRQVTSIASNAGHALGTGIVPPEHARSVADRLLADDMYSGWGIRTLSTGHPSFNPFAYHLGSVWPVEQATFALGFKRYGLDEQAERLTTALLEAASHMPGQRLPEVLSGHRRDTLSQPIPYPGANSPQAWSASAVIQALQIMLGIYPFAPLGLLALVRPRLPDWLPEVTVRDLRVGRASVDIRFRRRADGSAAHDVVRRHGQLLVVAAGPPHSVDTPRPLAESILATALDVMPGDRLRALRIALGVEQA